MEPFEPLLPAYSVSGEQVLDTTANKIGDDAIAGSLGNSHYSYSYPFYQLATGGCTQKAEPVRGVYP